ncbi:hypothetical protein LEP1GSC017_3959 [Leptospira meyeri serovar Hardjo str. Went 5]|nr:hypothetical protein LEP1GSC017_3959 [Leptospira meyeri serovar Hardjo str. Went 5]
MRTLRKRNGWGEFLKRLRLENFSGRRLPPVAEFQLEK